MQEITILSGKGGTGKTSITAALVSLAQNAVFCDSDVDAANLYLILDPEIQENHNFESGAKAYIDPEKCNSCGICESECRFDAISYSNGIFEVDPFACEGCRLCERICPAKAIHTRQFSRNKWFVSETRFGTFIHGRMSAGEENSGKLVSVVRKRARELAREKGMSYIINDGPPGIGCPVISSLSGTQMVLMVIEPSMSGLHDAERLLELVNSFNIPAVAVINKYDLSYELTRKAEAFLEDHSIPLLAKIPFDETFTKAMIRGLSIIEYAPESEVSEMLRDVWEKIEESFEY